MAQSGSAGLLTHSCGWPQKAVFCILCVAGWTPLALQCNTGMMSERRLCKPAACCWLFRPVLTSCCRLMASTPKCCLLSASSPHVCTSLLAAELIYKTNWHIECLP